MLMDNLYDAQHFHKRVLLPPLAAALLTLHPMLIAPVVNAFYYRDFDDILINHFPSLSSPQSSAS